MERVARHATPIHVKIDLPDDLPDPITAKFRQMTLGHRLLAERAYRDHALACFIAPDGMFSNGTIATILRHVEEGAHAVLLSTPPLVEEDMFDELRRAGVLANADNATGIPEIILEPRSLMDVAQRTLCDYMHSYNWESGHFAYWPSSVMWSVPVQKGFLYHSSYFWYILLDFSVLDHHETRSLDTASIENLWLSDNFRDLSRTRIIQDSDDAMVFCWTPRSASTSTPQWRTVLRIPVISTLWKGLRLRQMWAMHRSIGDFHKANNFRFPIRFHSGDLDSDWQAAERRAGRIMMWFLGDVFHEFVDTPTRRRWIPLLRIWWRALEPLWRVFDLVERLPSTRARFVDRFRALLRAISGNREDIARICRRLAAISGIFLPKKH
jgi:hypothetical protein